MSALGPAGREALEQVACKPGADPVRSLQPKHVGLRESDATARITGQKSFLPGLEEPLEVNLSGGHWDTSKAILLFGWPRVKGFNRVSKCSG